MMDNDSLRKQLARIRQGDQAAAAELFEEYARRLYGLARKHINEHLRPKIDPEDVVQSALGSFFRRHSRGEFEITDPERLWRLLAMITANKCRKWMVFYHANKRDAIRELCALPTGEDSLASWEAISKEPSPAEAAVLTETVLNLMANLQGNEREMLSLALQGCDTAEIAEQVHRSGRTVRRFLERIRASLESLQKDAAR